MDIREIYVRFAADVAGGIEELLEGRVEEGTAALIAAINRSEDRYAKRGKPTMMEIDRVASPKMQSSPFDRDKRD